MTHDDYLVLLERVFKQWPNMRPYAATAQRASEAHQIGTKWIEYEALIVTLFDKRTEERNEAQP
jgi:hypothetical protein